MQRKAFRKLHLGSPERLTAGLTAHEHPALSPDGKLIAYYAGDYGSINCFVADRRGRFGRRISPAVGNSTQPAWHPDGLIVAYRHQHSSDSKWELWETSLAGDTQPRQLLADPQWHYKHPCYDPAGSRIVYFSDEGTPGIFHLWLMFTGDGSRKQLTTGSTQMHCHPVFSPDGTRIVYHAYRGTDESATPPVTNLFELDLVSGELRELTRGEDQFKHPFYLDHNVITFHHERNSDGRRQICAMHLDSREIVRLTSGEDNDKHPYPWVSRKDRRFVAWSSKKLGPETATEGNTYDIFIAELLA